MKTETYNQKGEKIKEIDLPKEIFDVKVNPSLINQVVRYYEAKQRNSIAKTKDRSEVRGGGAKPWRQKGTGRARHGSRRSPIWIGGGVTFGPSTEKKYDKKINKKMLKKALFGVLSDKFKNGNILFVDKIEIKNPKTREIEKTLKAFSKIKKDIKNNKIIFILAERNENFIKASSNIKNVLTIPGNSLNPYFLMKGKYILMEKEVVENIDKPALKEDKKTTNKRTKKAIKKSDKNFTPKEKA